LRLCIYRAAEAEEEIMECPKCQNTELAVARTTEQLTTILECLACGNEWPHAPAAKAQAAGLTKYFCPVCPSIYADNTAPILTIGSPSAPGHRCDRTGSYRAGARWGRREAAMDKRLEQVTDEELTGWPLVFELKHERAATH